VKAEVRQAVLAGIAEGRPRQGPLQVHIDVTNGCNAACITCWDHSPLLATPRTADWKRRRLSWLRFDSLVEELGALGSVTGVVLSGMGDPMTHPDIYRMIRACKAQGWHVTVLTNLVAADADALGATGVDSVLVGVHGVTPEVHTAFHPGWNETHFFKMCGGLRKLVRAGVATKHVQVINRDTAPQLVEMVRFGRMFGATRVNYKLASLFDGTEGCSIDADQQRWLAEEAIPAARALALRLGVKTNLDLFAEQVRAAGAGDERVTTPIEEVGCFMGHVYTRITVDQEVLYCCNTEVKVGRLSPGGFRDLWWGARWQQLRQTLARGQFFKGCDKCGKFEQNVKWSQRVRAGA
jgi:MoaA/NifB/PqqE/SkfB family radical SAM enzyme